MSDFEWLSEFKCKLLEARLLAGDWLEETRAQGFILEVDLIYPNELHEEHNSFPLAPERLVVSGDMLSDYSRGVFCRTIYIICTC